MRVLLVSPHFPPINAPDQQRVRMSLPHLRDFGWEATVLTVEPNSVEGVIDPLLATTVPPEIEIVRTRALPQRWSRKIGLGSLAIRAFCFIRRAGDELLGSGRFDLVFFSTTMFAVMALGPRWARRFGVPYVLDFQDPWVTDYHFKNPGASMPGGRLKYSFSQWQARWLEPGTVRNAAHIVCVSPAYQRLLQDRYTGLTKDMFTTLPFAASRQDFDTLQSVRLRQTIFDPTDGRQHWVYTGAVPVAMGLTVEAFLIAMSASVKIAGDVADNVRMHFVGTDYAHPESGRKTAEPIAVRLGVDNLITERSARVPYFEALQCLLDADALIVFGSDDAGYTASKIFPYILARKPMLAIFHEESSVVEILRRTNAGTLVTFKTGDRVDAIAGRILEQWFNGAFRAQPHTDWAAFEPYTAREMTRKICGVFDRALGSEQPGSDVTRPGSQRLARH